MKIIILYIVLPIAMISCNLAKQSKQHGLLIYELPKNTVKITRDQLAKNVNQKEDYEMPSGLTNLYKIDQIIIGITNSSKVNTSKDHLKNYKIGFDDMFAMPNLDNDYSSVIENIGDNETLSLTYYRETTGFYTFFVTDAGHNQMINGKIQFSRSDEKRAKKIFKNLLESIKFDTI